MFARFELSTTVGMLDPFDKERLKDSEWDSTQRFQRSNKAHANSVPV
ncbi:hypothetical protein G3A_08815 [Bacillus sp. 17376]|nr:hypothetical protein G3A_08815 [Bacillus sp. 17376]